MTEFVMEAPNKRQQRFFAADARYVAYGGARGGGKSWAVRRKAALLALRYPGARILLVRRTLPELKENHVRPLMAELGGIAQYRENDHSFSFPNGSLIKLGFCASESDVLQYQGQEYDFLFIDEATQLTEYQFMWIASCCRGVNEIPKRIYLTCNPGGVGHAWVKRLFIDCDYRPGERAEDYVFIPAKAGDNAALREKDPGYLAWLDSLPDGQREAWRDGDWDAFLGQYFSEFRRDIHVVEPFVIPKGWRRYVSMDYGLDMCAVLWIAVAPNGRNYVYKEIHRKDLTISDAAAEILRVNNGEEIYEFLAPPDLWSRQRETGRTTAEIFSEAGLFLTKTSNNRTAGWLAVKEELKLRTWEDGRKAPRLQIFANCRHLIKNLPLLRHDERDPTDCATEPHEITHAPDALRGFCIYRTSAAVGEKTHSYVFSAERPRTTAAAQIGYGQKQHTI
ncbi:MAG: phage terminase large subunit [Clostridia bacterium]|nr:phage terminase large subunit [Clostridia bacterium]